MRSSVIVLSSIAFSTIAADLVVSQTGRTGSPTWTNSVSNAVYQVQWANSVTGPWTNFQSLLQLDLIQTTNRVITVPVPAFYRLAAQPASAMSNASGVYQYEAYDAAEKPLTVGWLVIGPMPGYPNLLSGTWGLGYVGNPTCVDPRRVIGEQIGKGELYGSVVGNTMVLDLTPNIFNDQISLVGTLNGGHYTGSWIWRIFSDLQTNGTFSATRIADFPR